MKIFTMKFKPNTEYWPNMEFYFTGRHRNPYNQYEIALNFKEIDGFISDEEGNLLVWVDNIFLKKYSIVNKT